MKMKSETFQITPVYDILLRGSAMIPIGLYHLHLATAEQLCSLHYKPGCLTKIKARLKDLADNEYIVADAVPTKRARSPYYYTLSRKGMDYLEYYGLDGNASWRESKETDKGYLFVQHTLEINDVLISAAKLEQVTQNACFLKNFIHERALKQKPYKTKWDDKDRKDEFSIIPDAFLEFHAPLPNGKRRQIPILLEHDRGTEGQPYFKKRIHAYIRLLETGDYQKLFGTETITIAFTTFKTGELPARARKEKQRISQIREWTREEIARTNKSPEIEQSFFFTEMTKPLDPETLWLGECWYTSDKESQPVSLLMD
jgi:hypothetical protein